MYRSRLLASIAAAALLVTSPVGLTGALDIAGPSAAQAQRASIDISFFFDELAPHGSWVRHERYRYVWVPDIVEADWAPYTNGHWVYTDRYGWMFVSDEPFAWAAYHYGRWVREPGLGWVWRSRRHPEWGGQLKRSRRARRAERAGALVFQGEGALLGAELLAGP